MKVHLDRAECPECGAEGSLCPRYGFDVENDGPFDEGPVGYQLRTDRVRVVCREGDPDDEPDDWANGGCGHVLTREQVEAIARRQGEAA